MKVNDGQNTVGHGLNIGWRGRWQKCNLPLSVHIIWILFCFWEVGGILVVPVYIPIPIQQWVSAFLKTLSSISLYVSSSYFLFISFACFSVGIFGFFSCFLKIFIRDINYFENILSLNVSFIQQKFFILCLPHVLFQCNFKSNFTHLKSIRNTHT